MAKEVKKVVPLADWILVEIDEAESVSKGGIVIPDSAKDNRPRLNTGTVLAVGPGKRDGEKVYRPAVEAGWKVCFSNLPGFAITVDGKKCQMLGEKEILGVIAVS